MFYDTEGKANGPTWVKLSIQKLIDFFEVETAEDVVEMINDDPKLLSEMGKILFNIMLYGYDRNNDSLTFEYRDMKALYGLLRQDVDSSYINYEKRVENGRKGGRPKAEEQEVDLPLKYPFSAM